MTSSSFGKNLQEILRDPMEYPSDQAVLVDYTNRLFSRGRIKKLPFMKRVWRQYFDDHPDPSARTIRADDPDTEQDKADRHDCLWDRLRKTFDAYLDTDHPKPIEMDLFHSWLKAMSTAHAETARTCRDAIDMRHGRMTFEGGIVKRKYWEVFSAPCPGDIIEHNGQQITVDSCNGRTLSYSKEGELSRTIAVADWRRVYGGARVIKIAETAPPDVIADALEAADK